MGSINALFTQCKASIALALSGMMPAAHVWLDSRLTDFGNDGVMKSQRHKKSQQIQTDGVKNLFSISASVDRRLRAMHPLFLLAVIHEAHTRTTRSFPLACPLTDRELYFAFLAGCESVDVLPVAPE